MRIGLEASPQQDYWRRGYDEEVMTNNELSNPKDENLTDKYEIAQIFRIDTNLFDFDTPLCRAFKEFNYLSQINVNVLTKDIPGFKTYEEYKDDWINEWNKGIPWVNKKPWINDGVWSEPIDTIHHECNPLRFKNRTAKWPTCNWKEDGYCNTRDLPGYIREGNLIRYEDYEWYDTIEDNELKEEALINKRILEESMNMMKESRRFDENKLIGDDDDDIGDLEDYLIQKTLLTMLTKKKKDPRREDASYLEFLT
ncbi:hypothetical protein Tco_1071330 [Tanacetum coccineum]